MWNETEEHTLLLSYYDANDDSGEGYENQGKCGENLT